MPYAIAAEFDDETVFAVDQLAARAAAVCGRGATTIASLGVPAHVTLAVYDDLPLDRAEAALNAYAAGAEPAELLISSVGVFPGAVTGSVAFLAPVVTPGLIALHRGCQKALARLDGACWDQYQPEQWVPHVTLALGLSDGDLAKTIACCTERWKPLRARLLGLRLAVFPPVKTLERWPFAAASA